ncbi:MAG: hypothetical protein KGJ84_12015 [Elusimicrobia bacterium]|nr:hypothetical protein [Elusimicrobiota bacterium]
MNRNHLTAAVLSGMKSLETPPDQPCADYRAPAPDPKAPKLKLRPGDDLDLSEATMVDAPGDLADWPITTRITELDMTPDGIAVAFSKRDGEGGGPAWGPMRCRQPRVGETIGIFVAAGSLRHVTDGGSRSPVKERSNVILVKMPGAGGASYSFP